jgi:hypothetical protein
LSSSSSSSIVIVVITIIIITIVVVIIIIVVVIIIVFIITIVVIIVIVGQFSPHLEVAHPINMLLDPGEILLSGGGTPGALDGSISGTMDIGSFLEDVYSVFVVYATIAENVLPDEHDGHGHSEQLGWSFSTFCKFARDSGITDIATAGDSLTPGGKVPSGVGAATVSQPPSHAPPLSPSSPYGFSNATATYLDVASTYNIAVRNVCSPLSPLSPPKAGDHERSRRRGAQQKQKQFQVNILYWNVPTD